MFGNLTGWHFLILAFAILLLFGASRLPELARGIGQSVKVFRSDVDPHDTAGEERPDAK